VVNIIFGGDDPINFDITCLYINLPAKFIMR